MPTPSRSLTDDYNDCKLIKLDSNDPKSPLLVLQEGDATCRMRMFYLQRDGFWIDEIARSTRPDSEADDVVFDTSGEAIQALSGLLGKCADPRTPHYGNRRPGLPVTGARRIARRITPPIPRPLPRRHGQGINHFPIMKTFARLIAIVTLLGSSIFLSACSTPGVQDARASGLDNRQDRIDSRTSARNARWQERGEREDARAKARFDSW